MKTMTLLLLFACATRPPEPRKVVFLCPHGGAKSVIAASYFNQLANELALPYVGVAAAGEDPYDAVPAPVVELLQRDGIDVRAFKPRRVTTGEVNDAAKVVSIDCKIEGVDVERWDDVPKVSVDIEASAAAIRRHVEELAAGLRGAQ